MQIFVFILSCRTSALSRGFSPMCSAAVIKETKCCQPSWLKYLSRQKWQWKTEFFLLLARPSNIMTIVVQTPRENAGLGKPVTPTGHVDLYQTCSCRGNDMHEVNHNRSQAFSTSYLVYKPMITSTCDGSSQVIKNIITIKIHTYLFNITINYYRNNILFKYVWSQHLWASRLGSILSSVDENSAHSNLYQFITQNNLQRRHEDEPLGQGIGGANHWNVMYYSNRLHKRMKLNSLGSFYSGFRMEGTELDCCYLRRLLVIVRWVTRESWLDQVSARLRFGREEDRGCGGTVLKEYFIILCDVLDYLGNTHNGLEMGIVCSGLGFGPFLIFRTSTAGQVTGIFTKRFAQVFFFVSCVALMNTTCIKEGYANYIESFPRMLTFVRHCSFHTFCMHEVLSCSYDMTQGAVFFLLSTLSLGLSPVPRTPGHIPSSRGARCFGPGVAHPFNAPGGFLETHVSYCTIVHYIDLCDSRFPFSGTCVYYLLLSASTFVPNIFSLHLLLPAINHNLKKDNIRKIKKNKEK
ncbi:putative signal peptide protein [Puccinia sorghi]|uniref:Putative signal peptide protein n=1 Tax=Puccinia sorghi TaxID=27349 RepID=A0A0L6VD21_9BASI|nr:putative signal peptide protein [Puccinia sorghi]